MKGATQIKLFIIIIITLSLIPTSGGDPGYLKLFFLHFEQQNRSRKSYFGHDDTSRDINTVGNMLVEVCSYSSQNRCKHSSEK